jgi:hypothetical protein
MLGHQFDQPWDPGTGFKKNQTDLDFNDHTASLGLRVFESLLDIVDRSKWDPVRPKKCDVLVLRGKPSVPDFMEFA